MNAQLRRVWSPPAELSTKDTGLRFTDVLFGFVIRDIFVRLQQWNTLDAAIRWQSIVAALLVLGSWIGFRRSVNRTDYEVKFVNLPLLRFVLDQAMIVLYFRLSSLSGPSDKRPARPSAVHLARGTAWNLLLIFGLYLLWDLLGLWMVFAKDRTKRERPLKYDKVVKNDRKFGMRQDPNIAGLVISLVFVLAFLALQCFADHAHTRSNGIFALVIAAALLFIYRFAKEVRSSWNFKPSEA
jgi:hypothetical protein